MSEKDSLISRNGMSYLVPFILVTSCFALWGFANDITNPMVKAFSKIFRMSVTDGALVQVVHPQVLIQGWRTDGPGTLCRWCPTLPASIVDGFVLSYPRSLLHSDLRSVVP